MVYHLADDESEVLQLITFEVTVRTKVALVAYTSLNSYLAIALTTVIAMDIESANGILSVRPQRLLNRFMYNI